MDGIYFFDGRVIPVCLCVQCRKVIMHVKDGLVFFPAHLEKDHVVQTYWVHRGTCSQKLMARSGPLAWQALDTYLKYLTQNAGLATEPTDPVSEDNDFVGVDDLS